MHLFGRTEFVAKAFNFGCRKRDRRVNGRSFSGLGAAA